LIVTNPKMTTFAVEVADAKPQAFGTVDMWAAANG
jgi:hypothetical protein